MIDLYFVDRKGVLVDSCNIKHFVPTPDGRGLTVVAVIFKVLSLVILDRKANSESLVSLRGGRNDGESVSGCQALHIEARLNYNYGEYGLA